MTKAKNCISCFKPLAPDLANCDECQTPVIDLFHGDDLLPLQFFAHARNIGMPVRLFVLLRDVLAESPIVSKFINARDLVNKADWDIADVVECYQRLVLLETPSKHDALKKQKGISLVGMADERERLDVSHAEVKTMLRNFIFPPIKEAVEESCRRIEFLQAEVDFLAPHLLTGTGFLELMQAQMLEVAMNVLLDPSE